jgi:hypothetical protein
LSPFKSEIRNSKSETNRKSEKEKVQNSEIAAWGRFRFAFFEFVSDFEFRISDFDPRGLPDIMLDLRLKTGTYSCTNPKRSAKRQMVLADYALNTLVSAANGGALSP